MLIIHFANVIWHSVSPKSSFEIESKNKLHSGISVEIEESIVLYKLRMSGMLKKSIATKFVLNEFVLFSTNLSYADDAWYYFYYTGPYMPLLRSFKKTELIFCCYWYIAPTELKILITAQPLPHYCIPAETPFQNKQIEILIICRFTISGKSFNLKANATKRL